MQDTERAAVDQVGGEARKGEAPFPSGPGVSRSWSDEEKALIVQESLERGLSVMEVAERHGVPLRRLSRWRKQFRKGELAVSSSPRASESESPFAALSVESAQGPGHVGSVSIESRGVTVRLDGDVSTVRITAIASALRGIR